MPEHLPVLLSEVLDLMNVQHAGTYIDATFGRGGHSRALLERLGVGGRLLVVDRDPDAVVSAEALACVDARVKVVHAPFSTLATVAAEHAGQVDGILFDVGLSSPQVDDPTRGFSFRHAGPLDMRMDPGASRSAAEWLAGASEQDIADVLWRFGEERRSRQIARRIVDTRRAQPLLTTIDLAARVRSCFPYQGGRIDPATRTFQAIRIFINDEIGELELAIDQAIGLLAIGGRLLVIAFHSLVDRVVKRRFRDLDHDGRDTATAPRYRALTRKPVMASAEERAANPRARSARLRALERVA